MASFPRSIPIGYSPPVGVVSAPLWNSDKSNFAGMLTVLDIIHLIQYYYRTATYAYAATDVEKFRLESLRGISTSTTSYPIVPHPFLN